MAKQPIDLTVQGHLNGDADGWGPFRGLMWALAFEGLAVVGFGVFLWWFWKK